MDSSPPLGCPAHLLVQGAAPRALAGPQEDILRTVILVVRCHVDIQARVSVIRSIDTCLGRDPLCLVTIVPLDHELELLGSLVGNALVEHQIGALLAAVHTNIKASARPSMLEGAKRTTNSVNTLMLPLPHLLWTGIAIGSGNSVTIHGQTSRTINRSDRAMMDRGGAGGGDGATHFVRAIGTIANTIAAASHWKASAAKTPESLAIVCCSWDAGTNSIAFHRT